MQGDKGTLVFLLQFNPEVFDVARRIFVILSFSLLAFFSSLSYVHAEEPEGLVTLEQALSLAFEKNPELSVFLSEIQVREARIIQARVFQNPEIELEIENIFGNKDLKEFDGAESTLSLGQTIELGGKRSKRTNLAALDRDLAQWDFEGKKLDVVLEVTKSFLDLLSEQEQVRLHEELVKLAEQSFDTVSARVQAGKASPIDETKASAALSLAKIELERARRSLDAARRKLSVLLGGTLPVFFTAKGPLDVSPSVPTYEELLEWIHGNPDIARWEKEAEQRSIALALEKANRIPNPVIKGGVRHFNEAEETAFVVGISLPLPIFNTNRGSILEAEKRLTKAEEEKRAAILKTQTALSEAYLTLSSSFVEATTLEGNVIPALQSAYDSVHEGYRIGKFGYLDVLDAQRGLFEAKIKYIDSLAAHKKAYADIERLTGAFRKSNRKDKERQMKNKGLIIFVAVAGMIVGALSTKYLPTPHKGDTGTHEADKHGEGKEEKHSDEKHVKLHDEDLKEFSIEVKGAGPGRLSVQRELPGAIVPNADRLAHIVPRVAGVVRQVFKNMGDTVKAGEILTVIDSRELADVKAAYLGALKRVEMARTNMKREEELWKKKISPEIDYLEARKVFDETQIELKSAEQKLHALGFSEEYVEKLLFQPDVTYTSYEIRAPFSGTVMEKHIALGEYLKDDKEAFVIADLSSVWVNISVYQKDMPYVRKGQTTRISAGGKIPEAKGVISYISSVTGEETRTAVARVVLPNPNGALRPGLFVSAKITVDELNVSLLVPKTALVTEGEKTEVFVETDEGFSPQPVAIGRSDDMNVEVTSGLKAGQRYVAKGGFTLKAQLGKGAFGDGHGH
jgi:RND family efflux transporter MFP subunit